MKIFENEKGYILEDNYGNITIFKNDIHIITIYTNGDLFDELKKKKYKYCTKNIINFSIKALNSWEVEEIGDSEEYNYIYEDSEEYNYIYEEYDLKKDIIFALTWILRFIGIMGATISSALLVFDCVLAEYIVLIVLGVFLAYCTDRKIREEGVF